MKARADSYEPYGLGLWGIKVKKFERIELWLQGLQFLINSKKCWSKLSYDILAERPSGAEVINVVTTIIKDLPTRSTGKLLA